MYTRRRYNLDLPLRMRRRQSDAKWRANVASCYETLKLIIPKNKRATKRQISKALILQETSKHMNFLEDILRTLLIEKAKTDDEEMTAEIVQNRLEEIQQDFVVKQRLKLEKHNRRMKAARHNSSAYAGFDFSPSPSMVSEMTLPFAQEVEISQASSTTEIDDLLKTLKNGKESRKKEKESGHHPGKPSLEDLEKKLAKATAKRKNQLTFAVNNYSTLIRRFGLHNAEHFRQQHERLFPNKTPKSKHTKSKMVTRSVPAKLHPVSSVSAKRDVADLAMNKSRNKKCKSQSSKSHKGPSLEAKETHEQVEVPTIKELVNEMVRASNQARVQGQSTCSNDKVPVRGSGKNKVTPSKVQTSRKLAGKSWELQKGSHPETSVDTSYRLCPQSDKQMLRPGQERGLDQAHTTNKNETSISPEVKVFISKQVPVATTKPPCNMSTHFNCIKKPMPKISLIFIPKGSSNQRSILLRPRPSTTKIIYIPQRRKVQNVQLKATTVPLKRPQLQNPQPKPRQPVARRQLKFTKGGREAHVTTNMTTASEQLTSISRKTVPTLSSVSMTNVNRGKQSGFTQIQIPPSPPDNTETDQAVPQIQKCSLTVEDLKLLCHEEIPSTDSDGSDLIPEDPLDETQAQQYYERSSYHSTPGPFDKMMSSYHNTPECVNRRRFAENKAFTDPSQRGRTKIHKPECCRSLFDSPDVDHLKVKSEHEEQCDDFEGYLWFYKSMLSHMHKNRRMRAPSEVTSKSVHKLWCRLTPEQRRIMAHMARAEHPTDSSQGSELSDDLRGIPVTPIVPVHAYVDGSAIGKMQYGPPYNPQSLVGQPMVKLEPEDDLGVVSFGPELVPEPGAHQVVPQSLDGHGHSQVTPAPDGLEESDAYNPVFGKVFQSSNILDVLEVEVAEATM